MRPPTRPPPGSGSARPAARRTRRRSGTAVCAARSWPRRRSARESRKTVTLVFADPKPTTLDGAPPSAEALRDVMTRYFEAMRVPLERHGGTVEKFIGDAVMAVFGLPVRHEDDAVRAVRAAADMQAALPALNEQFRAAWGLELRNHIGVNTGEVIAGDASLGQRLVTGDAVNTAARLEQAAGPMETILGDLTYRLARDQIEVEPIPPLTLKGKAEPVPAYRLVGVRGPQAERASLTTPFVGRAGRDGPPGDDPPRGRGDPVVPAGHDHRRRRRREVTAGARVRRRARRRGRRARSCAVDACRTATASRSGRSPRSSGAPPGSATRTRARSPSRRSPRSPGGARGQRGRPGPDHRAGRGGHRPVHHAVPGPELFWGIRKLLEAIASRRPLVAIVDDIHVAAPTFLELLDHLLDAVHGSPILLLATARRELLETRTEWAEGHEDESIVLEPLSADESDAIIGELLGGLEAPVRRRIVGAAEGNPLYVEQITAMLVETGAIRREGDGWVATSVRRDRDPADRPGAGRGSPRRAPERGAPGHRPGVGHRARLRGRRAGQPRSRRRPRRRSPSACTR